MSAQHTAGPGKLPEQWAQRMLGRVEKQRDTLLATLEGLVQFGELGSIPGADYVEIHRGHIAAAKRVCKRHRAATAAATGSKA